MTPAGGHRLEERALSLPAEAAALVITDHSSYATAAAILQCYVELRKEIVDHHAAAKRKAWEAHRAVCAMESKLLTPVQEAEDTLKGKMGRYYFQEQERIRAEQRRIDAAAEQQRIEAERAAEEKQRAADRLHEEQVEREMAAAARQGMGPEVLQEIAEKPAPIVEPQYEPPPPAPARVPQVKGISPRTNWTADVFSIRALAAAVGQGKEPEHLLLPNYPILNRLASSLRSALNIPGVRARDQFSTSVRTK